jgi:hypothetical protein
VCYRPIATRGYNCVARGWFVSAVEQTVAEIARLMRAAERGRVIGAHDDNEIPPAVFLRYARRGGIRA